MYAFEHYYPCFRYFLICFQMIRNFLGKVFKRS